MLQSLWNPFRDWNNEKLVDPVKPSCFKASETLLGIETAMGLSRASSWMGFKASETLLGIETGR